MHKDISLNNAGPIKLRKLRERGQTYPHRPNWHTIPTVPGDVWQQHLVTDFRGVAGLVKPFVAGVTDDNLIGWVRVTLAAHAAHEVAISRGSVIVLKGVDRFFAVARLFFRDRREDGS